jgi:hypothetical protein
VRAFEIPLAYRAKGSNQLDVSDIALGSTLWSRTSQMSISLQQLLIVVSKCLSYGSMVYLPWNLPGTSGACVGVVRCGSPALDVGLSVDKLDVLHSSRPLVTTSIWAHGFVPRYVKLLTLGHWASQPYW